MPIPSVLAFSTAGDAANGLLNGWDIATLQKWALIYLGLSSLAFVVVWLVGYLRKPG
ncbi:MAG: cytochrome B6 [Synechococcaceae bacterium WB8_1B_136]|nr:cytochrome B6 [Synechococcaceae bacterium WB8_1B_136]